MLKQLFILCGLLLLATTSMSQRKNSDVYTYETISRQNYRQNLRIPNIEGYTTLKCDFHVHSDISDGQVWPIGRVNEAWNDGLDAIAMTDHIEVRRFPDVIKCDHNKPYEIAKTRGDQIGMIVIPGAEITRKKPLGHLCTLFIKDANKLETPDELDAVNEAYNQGAFILWNHPGYPDKKSDIYPIHEKLIAEGKLHGVEVFNKTEAYPRAYGYSVKYNLTPFSNSDIHYMSGQLYPKRGSRPMTLVFVKERTPEAIKEALFAGRALAYFDGNMVGKEEYMRQIFDNALEIKLVRELNPTKRTFEIINNSDIEFAIRPSGYENSVPIYAGQVLRIDIKKGDKVQFTNCILDENKFMTHIFW